MKLITSKSLAKLRNLNLENIDLSFLGEDEKAVVERRLLGENLEEIGQALNKSPQRIWQIERRACYRILRRSYSK